MPKVSSLTGELILDINKWTAGAKQAQSDMAGLTKAISPLTAIAEGAGAALAGMATAVVGALAAATKTAADYGDALRDASIRTGLSTEALSGLKLQAEQSGTSFETLNNGLKLLSKNMFDAAQGGKKQLEAFAAVGVSVKDLQDAHGQLEPILRKVAEGFKNSGDTANQAAIAQKLLGKSGTELIETLQGGAEGIDLFRQRAELFGLAIGKDATDAADAFKDGLDNIKQAAHGLALTVGNLLLPSLVKVVNVIAASLIAFREWVDNMINVAKAAYEVYKNFDLLSGVSLLVKEALQAQPKAIVDTATAYNELNRTTEEANKQQKDLQDRLAETIKQQEAAAQAAARLKAVRKLEADGAKEAADAVREINRSLQQREDARLREGLDAYKTNIQEKLRLLDLLDKAQRQATDMAREAEEQQTKDVQREIEYRDKIAKDSIEDTIKANREAAEKISKEQEKITREREKQAEQLQQVWSAAIGNITADFTKGLADIIFEGKSFSETMKNIVKDMAKGMFSALLTGFLAPVTAKLGDLGAKLGSVLFGGRGAAPGGTAGGVGGAGGILGGILGGGGGVLGGIFGKGGAAAIGGTALSLGSAALTGGIAAGIPLVAGLIGGIGGGRKAANQLVASQNELQRQVADVLNDQTLSATNRSKIIENLFSGFGANAQAFGAGGANNATVANQAFQTLLPWMTGIRTNLAAQIQREGGDQTARVISNVFNFHVYDNKNAASMVAAFRDKILPEFINAIKSNADGVTETISIGVKNSIQGVVTTAA